MSKPAKLFVKGFKFPIYPTPEQIELLEQTLGRCCKVYNSNIWKPQGKLDRFTPSEELLKKLEDNNFFQE